MSQFSIQNYIDSPVLRLPKRFVRGRDNDWTITDLGGSCSQCGKPVGYLRGRIVDWPAGLDFRYAGVCPACRLVVFRRALPRHRPGTGL